MSEKKNKRDILIPKYDVNAQVDFIADVCKSMEFSPQTLITLIFAEWIYTFQSGTEKMNGDYRKTFYCYLEMCSRTAKKFQDLKKNVMESSKNEK